MSKTTQLTVQGLLPDGYHVATEITDAQNWCYRLESTQGPSLFMKVYKNGTDALVEYRLLRLLNLVLGQCEKATSLSLRVPIVVEYREANGLVATVCEFVEGESAKRVLLGRHTEPYSLCAKMVTATAQIHQLVSAYADDFYPRSPHHREFGPWSDCKARLERLLSDEGQLIFSLEDVDNIRLLLSPYFDILLDVAAGFPCDYYKDSNPANWIVDRDHSNLVAVDFESRRTIPFIVDLINIMEYASEYLTEVEKQRLLYTYSNERARLEPGWNRLMDNFDLNMLVSLFGLYRHQEQMLHRLRDLADTSRQDLAWHKTAYIYHLNVMRSHLKTLQVSGSLSNHRRRVLVRNINEVSELYQDLFCQYFQIP